MNDNETITFTKKELQLIMGTVGNDLEWILLHNLNDYDDLNLSERKEFEVKLTKMCSL